MSDNSISLVYPSFPEFDASEVGARALDWLVTRKIVNAMPTNCILSSRALGHPPGSNAFDMVAEKYQSERLFLKLRFNGLHLEMGKKMFADFGVSEPPRCPACEKSWSDAAHAAAHSEWLKSRTAHLNPKICKCEHCGHVSSIDALKYRFTTVFASLGLTFWNWPAEFRETMVDALSIQLKAKPQVVHIHI
jgi:hypothetical protein